MKRFLLFLLLAIADCSSHAQPITKYFTSPTDIGYFKGIVRIDSVLYIPARDTNFHPTRVGALVFRPADSTVYTSISITGPKYWSRLGSGSVVGTPTPWGQIPGNLSDQADLAAALQAKQNLLTFGDYTQYIRGDQNLGNFQTDVLAITDPSYSKIGHTHSTSDIIGLIDYIRNSISVTGNATYNNGSGVINVTGGGTGSYTFSSPLVNDGSGHISLPSIDASLITSGSKAHGFINDFDAYSRSLFSALLPLGYNQAAGAFSVDTTTYLATKPYVANYVATHTSGAAGVAGGDLSGNYPNPTVAQLNGQLPSYYLSRANHTGTQLSSTISDFTAAVQGVGDVRYLKPSDTTNTIPTKYYVGKNFVAYNSNGNVVLGGGADNGAAFRVPNGFVDIGGNQGSIWYVNGLGHLQELVAPAGLTSPYVGWDATNTAPKWYAGNATNQTITFNASGDVTGSATGTTSLSPTLSLPAVVTPGSCTNCNATFDAKGRVTAFSNGTGGSGGYSVTTTDTSHWNSTYRNSLKSTTIRNSLASGLDSLASTPNDSTMILKRVSLTGTGNATVTKVITDTTIAYTVNVPNSGVTSLAAGQGMAVSAATGAVTISNVAYDVYNVFTDITNSTSVTSTLSYSLVDNSVYNIEVDALGRGASGEDYHTHVIYAVTKLSGTVTIVHTDTQQTAVGSLTSSFTGVGLAASINSGFIRFQFSEGNYTQQINWKLIYKMSKI